MLDGPKFSDLCTCKTQNRRGANTEEKPRENGGRDGWDVDTSPGPLGPLEGVEPCPAGISDPGPPELRQEKFLFL